MIAKVARTGWLARSSCALACQTSRSYAGTHVAKRRAMAAVFALVFLFAFASLGSMFRANHSFDFGTTLALACFGTLAAGVFYGLLRMARRWESEEP